MPGYAGTGQAAILLQNHQVALFQREKVAAGTPSIAVQLERSRYAAPTAVAVQVYFTDLTGNPVSPGAFEIDVQGSDIDQDSQYCLEGAAYTGPLNGSFVGRVELAAFYAKYIRVFVRTMTNAVYVTAYITSFSGSGSSAGGGGGGGGVALEVNGTANADQSLLNLAAGTGVTITDEGGGTVEIAASGAVTLIAQAENPAGASVVFSAIPQTFTSLLIIAEVTPTSLNPHLLVEFNAQGVGNVWLANALASSGVTPTYAVNQANIDLGPTCDGRTPGNGLFTPFRIDIFGYRDNVFAQLHSTSLPAQGGAPYLFQNEVVGNAGAQQAITSLTFTFSDASDFGTPTRFSLYGMA